MRVNAPSFTFGNSEGASLAAITKDQIVKPITPTTTHHAEKFRGRVHAKADEMARI